VPEDRELRRRGALMLNINALAQLSAELLARELQARGVEIESLGLLTEIRIAEPVSPTALAARTGYPPTTLSDYVQRLIDRGEVERKPNPRDGRSYVLLVTPKGRERLQAASPAIVRVFETIAAGSGRRLDELEDVVADMRLALESALTAPVS
jgi:DNA-binding MarR family transcriptional regulator